MVKVYVFGRSPIIFFVTSGLFMISGSIHWGQSKREFEGGSYLAKFNHSARVSWSLVDLLLYVGKVTVAVCSRHVNHCLQ